MLLGLIGVAPASAQEVVEPPVPVLAISGGNNQSACVGMAYALPLQVTLIDTVGVPVVGAVVEFAAPSSGASIVPATFTATTDANGAAGATVTANGLVGAMDVYASYGAQTVMFQLTNTPELVVEISGGEDQSAVVETAYADPLRVTVTNLSVPVAGAVVEFVAPKHPGVAGLTLDRFSATTDASGVASAAVTANGYAGAMEVSASYSGQTVTFNLTNIVQPTSGSGPYIIAPRCEFIENVFAHDTAANGNRRVCLAQTNPGDCAKYNYCWWRSTADQNAIADQTSDQFTGVVTQIFISCKLKVVFYSTSSGANVSGPGRHQQLLPHRRGGWQGRSERGQDGTSGLLPHIHQQNAERASSIPAQTRRSPGAPSSGGTHSVPPRRLRSTPPASTSAPWTG